MFFVNTYGGTGVSAPQYGFSWINGNGVSVAQSIFSLTPTISPPRYDTLAHEIGHALALNHTNFGANTDTTDNMIGNLMLLGSTRATSYNSGCQLKTGNFGKSGPLILNNGALEDLAYATSSFNPCSLPLPPSQPISALADHLTTGACTDPNNPATCPQAVAAALSPFINKTLPNTANAGGGQSFLANSAVTSTTTSSGTPVPVILTISASGDPTDPDVPDLASNIIALLPNDPLSLNGNQPVTQVGGTGCDLNNMPSGCAVLLTDVTKLTNQQVTGNPGCDSGSGQPPSSQCIRLTYSGFRPGNNIVLAIGFNKDSATIIDNGLLAGAQYTTIDGNGFATTSLFVPVPTGASPPNFTGLTADSQSPDLSTPNVLLTQSRAHFKTLPSST
jgi:hypothetical protein